MRRSTETLIALQFLTVIVPVTLLLPVVLLAEARRAPAPGVRRNAGSQLPPHSLARIFHHHVAARQHEHGARVAWQPHLQADGQTDDQ